MSSKIIPGKYRDIKEQIQILIVAKYFSNNYLFELKIILLF